VIGSRREPPARIPSPRGRRRCFLHCRIRSAHHGTVPHPKSGEFMPSSNPSILGKVRPSRHLEPLEPRTLLSAQLVADLNPLPGSSLGLPDQSIQAGGINYFVADDGAHGPEVWRTDGTAEGTGAIETITKSGFNPDPPALSRPARAPSSPRTTANSGPATARPRARRRSAPTSPSACRTPCPAEPPCSPRGTRCSSSRTKAPRGAAGNSGAPTGPTRVPANSPRPRPSRAPWARA